MTWYPARPRRIIVKYVFLVAWGRRPLSRYFQHCSSHHRKKGEINLRNNKSVSLWFLPLAWPHVFSNKKESGLGWNWKRRLLMHMRKKVFLSSNQMPFSVSKKWILGNSKTIMLTAPRLWLKQSFCIAQCLVEYLRRLFVHGQHDVVLRFDAVAVWRRFWRERRPKGTRKL